MSGPLDGTPGRPSGITEVLLQFRQTPSSAEIRAGTSDAGHTGWIDERLTFRKIFCSGIAFLESFELVFV
jgi:hypothetical protein